MSSNKLFILLGYSKLQKNIIRVLNSLKIKTLVVNKNKLKKNIDQITSDSSNYLKIINKLKKQNIKSDTTALAYCGSEFGLNTCHKLNIYFKNSYYNSFTFTKKFLQKNLANKLFSKLRIKIPKKLDLKNAKLFLKKNKKIIIKPTNLSGSIGVELITNINEFNKFFKENKINYNKVILQEFVGDHGIDVNGYIDKNNNFFEMGIADRYFSSGKYRFPIYGVFPSQKKKAIKKKAYDILRKICKKTYFTDSFIKGDFILKNNDLYLLEATPRLHGDVLSTNSIFYNDNFDNPLNYFLRYFYFDEPLKHLNIKKNFITVWHAIFFKKKMKSSELAMFKKKLKKILNVKSIFFKNKPFQNFKEEEIIHKDNTSISGFFWFNLKKNQFDKKLGLVKKNFSDIILVK